MSINSHLHHSSRLQAQLRCRPIGSVATVAARGDRKDETPGMGARGSQAAHIDWMSVTLATSDDGQQPTPDYSSSS